MLFITHAVHAHRYTHANTHLYVCIHMQRCMHMGRFVQCVYTHAYIYAFSSSWTGAQSTLGQFAKFGLWEEGGKAQVSALTAQILL